MRNLGGAIGLALIDTVIYSRASTHGAEIGQKLLAGDVATAKFVGIPLDLFTAQRVGPLDATSQMLLKPLIEKAALTVAINDAWAVIAILTAIALVALPFCSPLAKATYVPGKGQ